MVLDFRLSRNCGEVLNTGCGQSPGVSNPAVVEWVEVCIVNKFPGATVAACPGTPL